MASQTRFGIMGCAQVARKLCRAILLAPNVALVAIGSRSGEKARKFIAENGLPESTRIHEGYEALLNDPDVDAVYMPLPTSLHVRWAVAAAEKGKHVLLEKPAALNMTELDRILEACEANDVQIMDGTMWMHHPRTAKMKTLLSDPDRFGQVKRPLLQGSRLGITIVISTDSIRHMMRSFVDEKENPLLWSSTYHTNGG